MTQSDQNKQSSDVRKTAAEFDEQAASLRDAMNALTQAHADVKNAVENGDEIVSLSALTAAVDDVTAAVGAVTNYGGTSNARNVAATDKK